MCRVDEFEDIGPYDDSDDERDALIKRNQVGDVLVARWTASCNTVEEDQAEPTSAGAGPLLGLWRVKRECRRRHPQTTEGS